MKICATPAPAPVPVTHDVKVRSTKKLSQTKALGVPPEEFGIEKGARNIRDCNYCFHDVVTKTEAQLIGEGFDDEQIKALGDYTANTNIETLERDTVGEHFIVGSASSNSAARLVKITEHYIRMDYEGNGRARLYQVITGGEQGEILRKNGEDCVYPIDVIPFAAATPVPQPHRFFGRSIADLVMPAQREKTALKRGVLDNMYLANAPRPVVVENGSGPNTIDDLLVHRSGAPIRIKTAGAIEWQTVPNIAAGVFPMFQYIDAELESRTGLSKQSQGIDANALQNQSATAVAQVFSASQLRVKLIARVMAEGVKDLFMLLHYTIRSHGQQAQTVRLRNEWVSVDPRNWKTRNDLTINVGLGSGGKAQQFAQMMALGNIQKEMVAGGKTNIVDDAKLFNMASEIVKIMGHKTADRFFNDPSSKNPDGSPKYPPPQAPADPKVMAIQAQAQNDQQELQLKAALDKQKAQDAAALAQYKAEIDARMKVMQAHLDAIAMNRQAAHDHQAHRANMAETALDMISTAHAHDTKIAQGQQQHDAKMQQIKAKPPSPGVK
jgi:hypothetical protein